jgi:hypothetical protein
MLALEASPLAETPLIPPDPETSEVKRRAIQAKAFAKGQLDEIKGRGPFFQAKLGVITGYVLVVLLTLALAPPGKPDWEVRQTRLSFGLSFKTALELTNADNGDLEDVIVFVSGKGIEFDGRQTPGTWRTKPMALPEGLATRIVAEQLFDDKGQHPPYSIVITSVKVLDGTDTLLDAPVPPAPGS